MVNVVSWHQIKPQQLIHLKSDKVNICCKDQLGESLFLANTVFMTVCMANIFTMAKSKNLNPIQAGVFWNHIGLEGTLCVPSPPLFLFNLWSNYNQTWPDGTLGQNLSKAIKILLTSSPGGKYDVIKLFLA